jgi:putative hydrolase of the HAD superfamily
MTVVALDGMGVLYSAQDDVLELLGPFIAEKGGICDGDVVQRIYYSASLGEITSADFWRAVKLDPALEDEYLSRHTLNRDLKESLAALNSRGLILWLLSNDLAEWSLKLRLKFGLEGYFQGFTVSGDVHARKPDSLIYRIMLKQSGVRAQDVIFVDDRVKNLDPAAALGFRTVLFDTRGSADKPNAHFTVSNFPALVDRLLKFNLKLKD